MNHQVENNLAHLFCEVVGYNSDVLSLILLTFCFFVLSILHLRGNYYAFYCF